MTKKSITDKTYRTMIDEMNEETRISRENRLSHYSVEELINALKKKSDKVEEIETSGIYDFTINTFDGNYLRSGPATILVVDKS